VALLMRNGAWTYWPVPSPGSRSAPLPLKAESIDAQALTKRVTDLFDVSRDAGRVRLLKLGHLAG
jgi:hypothetical protein